MTNLTTNAVNSFKDEQTNTKNYQESSTGAKIAGSVVAVANSVKNAISGPKENTVCTA